MSIIKSINQIITEKKDREYAQKRRILCVEWIMKIHNSIKSHDETLFLCIQIFDRTVNKVCEAEMNAYEFMLTCLWIASKFEESQDNQYTSSAFCVICNLDPKTLNLLKVELIILKSLNYNLFTPTVFSKISILKFKLKLDNCRGSILNFLIHITSIDEYCNKFGPSITAVASTLTLMRLDDNFSKKKLFEVVGHIGLKVEQCADRINCIFNGWLQLDENNVITSKFSEKKHNNIYAMFKKRFKKINKNKC